MNWRGGFFRLWVALTVVWLVVVGIFTYDQILYPSGYIGGMAHYFFNPGNNQYEIYNADTPRANELASWKASGTLSLIAIANQPDWTADLYIPSHQSDAELQVHAERMDAIMSAKSIDAAAGRRKASIKDAIGIGVLVPLSLLLAGLGLGWVLSGFRSRA
ncbi:hypothetical protein [Phyllobacterium bourgognense]|uniref:Uncharacterized protein n=1 Tax=Phyllobacterium bourgognense TaxID=314236 RepID=A0A368YSW5_9HYPH|nr:hypothetical protein [Phyllobacterium bourgognense]RCW82027.1 hypothetical protein C7476_109209 [Phyllobacterium bourgognense]